MERAGAGLRQFGFQDLARRQAELQAELQRRTGLKDFPLRGPLLPERFAPDPAELPLTLEGNITHHWPLVHGGRSKQELLGAVKNLSAGVGLNVALISESPEFTLQPDPHIREVVVVPVDILVPDSRGRFATTEEIDQARDEKGLEPVYTETAHQILLQHGGELKVGEAIWMNMKPMADRNGGPVIFYVDRFVDGLWLGDVWESPGEKWHHSRQIAFFLPQAASNS